MMVLDLCRVTVRTCGFGTSTAVDLTLPTSPELGEILSAIVDLVGVGHETADGGYRSGLRLARVDGSALDESVSLLENGIRDGDVLLLAAERHTEARTALRRPGPACRRNVSLG